MTDMPTEFTDEDASSGQRINGVIDVPRPGRVAGWAIDRADPQAAVTVTVLRDGRPVAQVVADAHRPDLERGGIGTGRYGFALDLDPPLEPGFEFTVGAVARAADGVSGDLRPVGRARPTGDAARRLVERCYMELCALRAAVGAVEARRTVDAETRVFEALDRVEIVQARLEQALGKADTPGPERQGRALILAVGIALATGAGSLALGVWSMLG